MTEDIELKFGNMPVLKGPDVRKMFTETFQRLDMMEHYIEYFDFVPPKIYQAARIRYRVKGDDVSGKDDIEIPGFAVFFVREDASGSGMLECYRMETYLDPSPLMKRIEDVNAGN